MLTGKWPPERPTGILKLVKAVLIFFPHFYSVSSNDKFIIRITDYRDFCLKLQFEIIRDEFSIGEK
jgi:hypothetical protein